MGNRGSGGIEGLGHWDIGGLGRSGEIHGVLSPDI